MAGSAKERYAELEQDRRPYLDRGRTCAKLTIPSLLPDEGANEATTFVTPEQSFGAHGLNSVAAKLLLALFPPNAPFLKMEVDEMTSAELTQTEGANTEVNKALSMFVRKVMTDFEGRAMRADLYEVFRLLAVSGNCLLYIPEEGRSRVYRLDKYVTSRSPDGTVIEVLTKEKIAQAAIPEEVMNAIPDNVKEAPSVINGVQTKATETAFDLYTHIVRLDDGSYQVHQEVEEVVVPGSEGTYTIDDLPFLPLRYIKVDGESYGRGLVEEHLGDLLALESFTKALREFTAIASLVRPLVNPNGSIDIDELMSAENGKPIEGAPEDVTFLQIERYNDFRVQSEFIKSLQERLSFSFLLNTAIQRPGERVTAEEIRYAARELEDILGGTYSVQAVDLQLPIAKILIKSLEARGALPELPGDVVSPRVVTGMDALGRGADITNLVQFKNLIADTPAAQSVKWEAYAQRVANALNVETDGLVMSAEEIQAQQQQQMMQMAMEKGVGPAVTQLGQMAQAQQAPAQGA